MADLARRGPHMVSGRMTGVLIAGLVVALALAAIAAISIGSVNLPVGSVWRVVGAHLTGSASGDPLREQVVWEIRTPRVLVAALVGAGLSAAGVALQALVRNPLADPYVLGISSGASLGAVLVVSSGVTLVGGLGVTGAAFATAVLSVLVVYLLAQRGGRLLDSRLVLAGVAVGYLCSAATSYIQLQVDPTELHGLMFWLMGSVAGVTWSDLGLPAAVIAVCTLFLLAQGRGLNALAAGDDAAAGLGASVRTLRIALLVVASLLTATSVSVVGGIGFVGLMVPHTARFLVGGDHRRVLPVATLGGAVFLVAVDIAARTVDRPNELPIGIFTTGLGVPFFLWLLRRRSGGEH
ncbi:MULTISPECIES: iron ABC transporter permease [Actinomadura]|uniref:Iron chelate uptake ABC transporter family permease subunit n=1 Tax=Actinomadura litoris TaxID=2678616 RepID=A0A7K1LEA3_9ACTN|nr:MULTISPECIES: iron ABC transporter permease [Actinomadura]MBT2214198.1 iron ABC transporter permease [Actinomadura sp. NEAU-AAG7]MUN42643.1 iron chelate uptake ABC transporter family permease subunit [Actinomadura litoris]